MLDTTGTRELSEPGAVTAALWLRAWLRGQVGADDLLSVLERIAPDTPSVLRHAGGTDPTAALLQRIRGSGAVDAWPLLPRAGRAVGWPRLVGEPSPAVLVVGRAGGPDRLPLTATLLLRARAGGWIVDELGGDVGPTPGRPAEVRGAHVDVVTALTAEALTPRAATRRFAALVEEAAQDLGRLGLARPATAPEQRGWVDGFRRLPPGADGPLGSLLERAAQVLDAVDQALRDDGAAVTAGEARARAAHLRRLRGELCDLVVGATVGPSPSSADL